MKRVLLKVALNGFRRSMSQISHMMIEGVILVINQMLAIMG